MSLSDPEANTQPLNSTHLSSQGWTSSKALFCEQNKINVDHKHAWRVDPWCAVFHARILVLKSNQDQGQVLNLIPAKLMFWRAFTHDTEKIPKKGCSRACAKGPAPTAVSTTMNGTVRAVPVFGSDGSSLEKDFSVSILV